MISNRIQEQRKLNGLTQEQLAEKLNVSRQSISKWESNQAFPEIDRIILMSEIFNVSTDYLLKEKTNDYSKNSTSKDYNLIGIILISIGLILSLLWYEYLSLLPIVLGLIIQIIGLSLMLSNNISLSKNYKIKCLISFWLLIFIPLNLFINLFFTKSLGLIFTTKGNLPLLFLLLYILLGTLGSIILNKFFIK